MVIRLVVDVGSIFDAYLGEKADKKVRRLSINSAIFGFIMHLLICLLFQLDLIDLIQKRVNCLILISILSTLHFPYF